MGLEGPMVGEVRGRAVMALLQLLCSVAAAME